MPKKNIDIREAIKKANFPQWMIADRMGVTDTTFSRWLRKELAEDKKQEIFNLIKEIKQEIQ
jgi:predicted XRE-type DNA-binding protein